MATPVNTPVTPKSQATPPKPVIQEMMAQRKSCAADGVGLSHYILMDRKSR